MVKLEQYIWMPVTYIFFFIVNGDYNKSMFVFYKKDVLSRNIK